MTTCVAPNFTELRQQVLDLLAPEFLAQIGQEPGLE